jgi:hypothetical protein
MKGRMVHSVAAPERARSELQRRSRAQRDRVDTLSARAHHLNVRATFERKTASAQGAGSIRPVWQARQLRNGHDGPALGHVID